MSNLLVLKKNHKTAHKAPLKAHDRIKIELKNSLSCSNLMPTYEFGDDFTHPPRI